VAIAAPIFTLKAFNGFAALKTCGYASGASLRRREPTASRRAGQLLGKSSRIQYAFFISAAEAFGRTPSVA
jgi:hypothetical protein